MGLSSLNARLQDPAAVGWVQGVFPKVLMSLHSAFRFTFGQQPVRPVRRPATLTTRQLHLVCAVW